MAGKFVLKRSGDGFMFNLVAANGQTVLTSERYTSKDAALSGAASVQMNAGHAGRYEVSETGLRFNLKAANGQVIGSSESYSSADAAQGGIQAVMRAADGAEISDET